MISSSLLLSRNSPFCSLWLTYSATIEGSGGEPVQTGGNGQTGNPGLNTATTQGPDPCPTYAPCVEIGNAINSCEDDSCFCPTLLAYGSQCSSCFVPVNATEASGLSLLMSECRSEGYSPLTTGGGQTITTPGEGTTTAQTEILSPTSHTVSLVTATVTAGSNNGGTTTTGTSAGKASAAQKSVSFSPVFCALLAVMGASLVILFA
jgi:hypothetical protein